MKKTVVVAVNPAPVTVTVTGLQDADEPMEQELAGVRLGL